MSVGSLEAALAWRHEYWKGSASGYARGLVEGLEDALRLWRAMMLKPAAATHITH
jgi:hypothetical protein